MTRLSGRLEASRRARVSLSYSSESSKCTSDKVSAFCKISSLTRWPSSTRKSERNSALPRCAAASNSTSPISAPTQPSVRSVASGECVTTASMINLPTYASAAGTTPDTMLSSERASVMRAFVCQTSASARQL
ncbi:MAG TPA: hypothetical protein VMG12_30195 [Polyangiaceae bacterium]|nr:hypothetical protein [Polyangiaceae bacterium]